MKRKFNHFYLSLLGGALLTLGACSKNDDPGPDPTPIPDYYGVFVLNEGQFGQQNASLGFIKINDMGYSDTTNLGNNGNDAIRFGGNMYITVTESNKVVVVNYYSGKIVKTIPMKQPRNLAYLGKNVFVTNYNNRVVAIDTTSLTAVDSIEVGRTPEEIVRMNGKLYVANSGSKDGWSNGNFDKTISVLNPSPLSISRTIEVAENVTSLTADSARNRLYANTSAIDASRPSRLYVINTQSENEAPVKLTFGANRMLTVGNQALLISDNFEPNKKQILLMDLTNRNTEKFIDNSEIKDPYALAIHPVGGEIWIADANGYSAKGKVYVYNNTTLVANSNVNYVPKKFIFRY
jgi:YVTN family beta-propeller protein